jgi:hypothetical protein
VSVINTNEAVYTMMNDEQQITGWMQGPAQVGGLAGLAPLANPALGNLSFPIGASLSMPALHIFPSPLRSLATLKCYCLDLKKSKGSFKAPMSKF